MDGATRTDWTDWTGGGCRWWVQMFDVGEMLIGTESDRAGEEPPGGARPGMDGWIDGTVSGAWRGLNIDTEIGRALRT